MANQLDPMDIHQIIQLHSDGISNREIGSTLGISRNTINEYIRVIKSSDISIKELLGYDSLQLRSLFPSSITIDEQRHKSLLSFFEQMRQDQSHKGFTFQHHYKDYHSTHSNAYSYTQFMEHYHRKYPKEKGSMKLDHLAGHELLVDYAGKRLEITDKQTGATKSVEVFVAILPFSQYTYVEASLSQKREDFINSLSNALTFIGGVPKAIVSDNLKSAVSRSSRYEPKINKTFKDFGAHHSCVVNPTRSYSPQDKALVEHAVRLVYQRIYYPIRNMTFFSLAELNKEIKNRLEGYNKLLFQRKDASRASLFNMHERCSLKPLASTRFEIRQYCKAKVQKMGYVYFSPDKTYYSVPYRFIGKQTMIEYRDSSVGIYYQHQRITTHKRVHVKGSYITNNAHLNKSHQAYNEYSPSYFEEKAKEHGQYVEQFIKILFANGDYPEVNYKRASGILSLSKIYESKALDDACKMAIEVDYLKYQGVKNILKSGVYKMSNHQQNGDQDSTTHIPEHENIRGASAYQ